MDKIQIEKVKNDLEREGFTSEQIQTIDNTIIRNLPPGTYNKAVLFLGWVTVALALGSIALAATGKPVPEALWGALGAGIGGLAGIFMGKQ